MIAVQIAPGESLPRHSVILKGQDLNSPSKRAGKALSRYWVALAFMFDGVCFVRVCVLCVCVCVCVYVSTYKVCLEKRNTLLSKRI